MYNTTTKQNRLLFGSVIVLLSLILVITYFSFSNRIQSIDTQLFQVEDWKSIQEIVMQNEKQQVKLSFREGAWRVNDQYKADRNLIDVIFATLIQSKAKREITGSQKDSLLNHVKKTGVKIDLKSASGSELSFIAGGNLQKSNAYFVSKDDKVYQVHIPGYRVYVSGIFELAEGEWLDKLIFDVNWINFKKLTYTYENENFNVVRQNNLFQIEGQQTDTAKLHQFLDRLSLLQVNQFQLDADKNKLNIIGDINLVDIADRPYHLWISDSVNRRERLIMVKDSLPAWVDESEIQTLLKSREFYQKSRQ